MGRTAGRNTGNGIHGTPDVVKAVTTVEYFAWALRECGEGNYILLKDAVRIMQHLGWTTKSGTRDMILRNVHSRVYKHGRHVEAHPEDSLGIDFSESSRGLYRVISRTGEIKGPESS